MLRNWERCAGNPRDETLAQFFEELLRNAMERLGLKKKAEEEESEEEESDTGTEPKNVGQTPGDKRKGDVDTEGRTGREPQ